MTNIEALVIFYSATIQPLLIRWIAQKEKKRWKKILCIVCLSIIAGSIAYIAEHGRPDFVDIAKLGETMLTIFALSIASWSTAWKKVFPYKEDPASYIDLDKR